MLHHMVTMRPARAMFLFTVVVYLRCQIHFLQCFAQRNRNYADYESARIGTEPDSSAAAFRRLNRKLSSKEKQVVSLIADAGKAGRWDQAQNVFSDYAGLATQVYSAFLTAAFRCGKFADGYRVYTRVKDSDIEKDPPLLTAGMKLASMSNHPEDVHDMGRSRSC